MKTEDLFDGTPIEPVVVIEDSDKAVPLAEALLQGGINAMEITLRTDAALAAIENVANAYPEMTVGAGSIRQAEQVNQAAEAGSRFQVSPGFTMKLIAEAKHQGVHLIPGAATAAEAMQLHEEGFELIKFFPAEPSGGLKMIKAISAPLPELRFFPTGGITKELAPEYLSSECIKCVGGTWFVSPTKIAQGDFGWVTAQVKEALSLLHSNS